MKDREKLKNRVNGILVELVMSQVADEKPEIMDYTERILKVVEEER